MKRTDIINLLIQKINAKKYLEIGVSDSSNFSNVKCDYKVGVDPSVETSATFHLTSDQFFAGNEETFDIIFIDGLHHADQVYKDVINSLEVLNEGGYIVCHDLNPVEEQHQIIPYQGGAWNGDCWKAFVMLRMERDDLEMFTVDADCGCGIISRGSQELLDLNHPLTYYYLDQNRKELLNLISEGEFLSKFPVKTEYDLSELLKNYLQDPEDPENNFSLALYYDEIGQTASALSYYLRCAERADDDLLRYECLIRGSMCFDKQGTRNFTVKSFLLHSLALCPDRPEGYYLMSRFYEKENKDGSWNESYTIASIGLKVANLNPSPLRTSVDYPGEYALHFRKALTSWHCGLCEESRDLFVDLLDKYEMDQYFHQTAIDSLKRMNVEVNNKPFAVYDRSKFDKLRIKFAGSETIQENYSEAYQDMFVLMMLNGKRNGTYLEVGAGNAFYGNNTALLEKEFDWKGVSLDIDEGFVAAHTNERKNPCLLKDATKINYEPFLNGLEFPNEIDYLQLDCDPPEVTYKILLSMPFDTHKFAVITYEHDYYCDETKSFQNKSKRYLESYGYVRVVNNISPDDNRPYEDWWVHPDLVDKNIFNQMIEINDSTKKSEKYILSGTPGENVLEKTSPNKDFEWGLFGKNKWMFDSIKEEFEGEVNYEKFFVVEENDIVVDIGASVGPFTKSILSKNPSLVLCLEPHAKLFETLHNNLSGYQNVKCFNKGISLTDGVVLFENLFDDTKDENYVGDDLWKKREECLGITFKTLVKENNLEQIDFLKTDCEGGEYDIFTPDNFYWIKNNVKKIAGEWHLHNDELKQKFLNFRDFYLRKFDNFKIFFVDYHSNFFDITNEVWSDDFVNKYGWVNVYVDNR